MQILVIFVIFLGILAYFGLKMFKGTPYIQHDNSENV